MGDLAGVVDLRPDDAAAIEEMVALARRCGGQSGQQAEMPSYRHYDRRKRLSADDLAVELAIRRRIRAIERAAGVHRAWHGLVPDKGRTSRTLCEPA
jgi:hypothetical protein